jgi:hypothetical protein
MVAAAKGATTVKHPRKPDLLPACGCTIGGLRFPPGEAPGRQTSPGMEGQVREAAPWFRGWAEGDYTAEARHLLWAATAPLLGRLCFA